MACRTGEAQSRVLKCMDRAATVEIMREKKISNRSKVASHWRVLAGTVRPELCRPFGIALGVSCFPHPPTQHIAVAIPAPYLELDIVALYIGHPGVIDGWSGIRLTPFGPICGSEGSTLGCCNTGQLAVVSPSSPLLPCVGEPIINPTIILSWSADRGDRLGYTRPIRCARRMFIFMFLPQYFEASLLCATTRSDEPRIQTGLAACLGPAPTQSPFQTDHSLVVVVSRFLVLQSHGAGFAALRADARLHETARTDFLRDSRGSWPPLRKLRLLKLAHVLHTCRLRLR